VRLVGINPDSGEQSLDARHALALGKLDVALQVGRALLALLQLADDESDVIADHVGQPLEVLPLGIVVREHPVDRLRHG